jgi:hypothetical protein
MDPSDKKYNYYKKILIPKAYSFTIEADPDEIVKECKKHWKDGLSKHKRLGLGENCAASIQWFLEHFANIPAPNHSNVSLNYFTCSFFYPSVIPCPATLPGRVMSNAKFYLEARKTSDRYSYAFLYLSLITTSLSTLGSISLAIIAVTALLKIAASGAALLSIWGVGNSYNKWSAKHTMLTAKSDYRNNQTLCVNRLKP